MKVSVMLYKNHGPGHVAIKAWEPGTTKCHWLNFTGDHYGIIEITPLYKDHKDASLDKDGYYSERFEFETTKTLWEFTKWHLKSKFFGEKNFSLINNNCSHAVRAAMEFFGYDMRAADNIWLTPLLFFIWVPSPVSTPRSVFMTARNAVLNDNRLSPKLKTAW